MYNNQELKLSEKEKLNYFLKHGKHIEDSWLYFGKNIYSKS